MAKPGKRNTAQTKFIVGAVIIVGAIGYLMYAGVKASGSYYYKVSEVLAMGPRAQNMSLRLEGKVVGGSIKKDVTNLKLSFDIEDESEKTVRVYYEGVTPDMFQDGIDVVVEGRMSRDGQFVATKLLTSCPSRYEASEEVKQSI